MLEIAVVIVIAIAVWRGVRNRSRGRRGGFKCRDCRHLIRGFDDGVRCGYGGGDVFKTPVHISNCMDWERR